MKSVFLLLMFVSQIAFAHDHHSDKMKADSPLEGASLLQLSSTWKNQNGASVKLTELQGKGRLVVMLFTRCQTACPLLVEDLKSIATELSLKQPSPIEVSIFSLDSFRETPDSLRAFAVKRKLPSHWGLFTSNANDVAELAAALGVRYKRLPDGDFIHSNVIYFLNKNGEVVAQKEGLKTPRAEFLKQIKKNL